MDLDAELLSRWGASAATLIADTPTSRVSRVSLTDGGTAVVKDLKPIGAEEELRGIHRPMDGRDGRSHDRRRRVVAVSIEVAEQRRVAGVFEQGSSNLIARAA